MDSRYPDEELRPRFADLRAFLRDYVAAQPGSEAIRIEVDDSVLANVVRSAFDDIQRYKDYHLEAGALSDAVKRSAYLTKWLVRLRPISVFHRSNGTTNNETLLQELQSDSSLLINEKAAIVWAFTNIAKDAGLKWFFPTNRKLKELYYILHFRNLSEDLLLAIFQIFNDIALDVTFYQRTKRVG